MLSRLYDEGFVFFDGIEIPSEDISFILDKNNYIKGQFHQNNNQSRLVVKDKLNINSYFPKEVKDIINMFSVTWGGVMVHKGFELNPHNDSMIRSGGYNIVPGMALVLFWVCETPHFIGRDFVWGKIKDLSKVEPSHHYDGESTAFAWDDQNLEVMGSIKPKTGSGVIIDRTNPIWWHGVTQLLNDTSVVSISGSL